MCNLRWNFFPLQHLHMWRAESAFRRLQTKMISRKNIKLKSKICLTLFNRAEMILPCAAFPKFLAQCNYPVERAYPAKNRLPNVTVIFRNVCEWWVNRTNRRFRHSKDICNFFVKHIAFAVESNFGCIFCHSDRRVLWRKTANSCSNQTVIVQT